MIDKLGRPVDLLTGIMTGMLTGYLTGMVIGFTVFDPNLDVWALLGFVMAIAGIGLGLWPAFRRHLSPVLGAVLGFYAGWLASFVLLGDDVENGLDLLENGPEGLACVAIGAALGGGLGAWLGSRPVGYVLFASVFGGYIGGLVFGVALGLAPEQTMLGWAPSVIISGLACGGSVVWYLRRSGHDPNYSDPC